MLETIIQWHDAKKERPEKSEEYWCVYNTEYGYVNTLCYSKKWNSFNSFDSSTIESVRKNGLHVKYWAEIPKEFLKEASRND